MFDFLSHALTGYLLVLCLKVLIDSYNIDRTFEALGEANYEVVEALSKIKGLYTKASTLLTRFINAD